jgi:hypothetical protein
MQDLLLLLLLLLWLLLTRPMTRHSTGVGL